MMKRCLWIIGAMSLLILISQPVFADEKEKPDYSDEPWETAGLYLGAFVADINSSLDLGFSGSGISVSAWDIILSVWTFQEIVRRRC
jgi:hypothetical protein